MKTCQRVDGLNDKTGIFEEQKGGNGEKNRARQYDFISVLAGQEGEKRNCKREGAEKQKGARSSPQEIKGIDEKKQRLPCSRFFGSKAIVDDGKERQYSD